MPYIEIELTEGNVRNQHMYLADNISFFPVDTIGGANVSALAARQIEIHHGVGAPTLSDIAGDKKIFRKRAWVQDFLDQHNLVAGDRVIIDSTGPYRIHVYPKR